ncbi:hypothetical protein MAXJ12_23747 [Mesorhizobium alhagi CCNWXJ12-2]|uniref:Uncharacterized protein n=1 Tax=Mesorhizobium alhagi CCNWXJ12-2 TaxID=1107882 RepID=H0HX30_9HYPH|nr:hypothetical protein MAXJ12_23747 [Mesorhizobium alhagi CCNWXJ12-2]
MVCTDGAESGQHALDDIARHLDPTGSAPALAAENRRALLDSDQIG